MVSLVNPTCVLGDLAWWPDLSVSSGKQKPVLCSRLWT